MTCFCNSLYIHWFQTLAWPGFETEPSRSWHCLVSCLRACPHKLVMSLSALSPYSISLRCCLRTKFIVRGLFMNEGGRRQTVDSFRKPEARMSISDAWLQAQSSCKGCLKNVFRCFQFILDRKAHGNVFHVAYQPKTAWSIQTVGHSFAGGLHGKKWLDIVSTVDVNICH